MKALRLSRTKGLSGLPLRPRYIAYTLWTAAMVRVAVSGKYKIYLYDNEGHQPHKLPHCHVVWPDGSAVVSLRDFTVLAGDALPREARELLRATATLLIETWKEKYDGE